MLSTPASYKKLSAYFIPLALQAASQSLTYPLVAMVASAGVGGALNLAGVAQSNTVMFLIGTLGAGLITSGMVFGTTKKGFQKFVGVNTMLMLATMAIQAIMCVPVLSHWVFGVILGLPASIERPAFEAYPWTILLNALFFLRNPYQVKLYNNGAAGKASMATLSRVVVTLALSPLFTSSGLVGPAWAMICQTGGVGAELALSWWFCRGYQQAFIISTGVVPRRREIFKFNIPLAIGGFLMTFSGLLLAGFIARADQPEHMLPAFYIAIGVVNPIAYGAGRMTNVVLRFPPASPHDRETLVFSIFAGLILCLVPLLFLIPVVAHWYYIGQQRIDPADLHLVYGAALSLVLYPLIIALRGHQEGLAAYAKKTHAILAGNIAYLAALGVVGFELLTLKVPGNLIGTIGIMVSNIIGLATVTFMLRYEEKREAPSVIMQVGQDSQ